MPGTVWKSFGRYRTTRGGRAEGGMGAQRADEVVGAARVADLLRDLADLAPQARHFLEADGMDLLGAVAAHHALADEELVVLRASGQRRQADFGRRLRLVVGSDECVATPQCGLIRLGDRPARPALHPTLLARG